MKATFAMGSALLFAACGGSTGNPHHNPDAPGQSDAADNPDAQADAAVSNAKPTIFTIVLENHDYAEIVGSSNAPYINSLIAMGGLATNYKDTGHPSLPNYLNMISGDNQYWGITDWAPNLWPFPKSAPNLGTQLEGSSIPWRSYQESMGTPCNLNAVGLFAPKHDGFLYFEDMQGASVCADRNVDYSSFAADLASNNYRYMWITPNLDDDGHNQTDPVVGMQATDTWMSHEVPKILASAAYQAGGVLFITWDEAEGRNNDDKDQIPMIILSPRIKQAGMTSATAYTHSSYLATVEDLLSLPRLEKVQSTPSMMMEFLHP
jgi:hypothetical protein